MTTFFVSGIPVAKGSMRAYVVNGRPVITDTKSLEIRKWSASIRMAAENAEIIPTTKPIFLFLTFYLPRPKSHYGSGANEGKIRESVIDLPHVKKPDLDKLVRMVLDSLTGLAYIDDSQVIFIQAEKLYLSEDSDYKCGVKIEIEHEYEREP